MSALTLVRPEILALEPYSSARMEAVDAAVMLNANESPWPPNGDELGLNRYPDPQPAALRQRLAELYEVDAQNILIGRGSDEAIDLLVRAFCRPGQDAIAISPPTFGMYAVCAGVQGAGVESVLLDGEFALDADRTLASLSPAVKLLFVCSPNNPTGGLVPLATIARLASGLAGRAMVIVDEAYIEFACTDSASSLLRQHANLGVLRTLSKAWALAGARIGSLLAHADVIALLRRIMLPYPVPTPCVAAAMSALELPRRELSRVRIATIVNERKRLAMLLPGMPGVERVYPSHANFLTARMTQPELVYRALAERGIVVRDVGHYPGLAGCLRFSIGTPQENEQVIETLARLAVKA